MRIASLLVLLYVTCIAILRHYLVCLTVRFAAAKIMRFYGTATKKLNIS